MIRIVIAFPKLEDGQKIRTMLLRNGYEVDAVYNTAAQVLSLVNALDEGIVITGYSLPDMQYAELADCLPNGFRMLLMASRARLGDVEGENIISIGMPLKLSDLLGTLEMMCGAYREQKKKEKEKRRGRRSEKEKAAVDRAKALLMERNHMSEEEAHRYIQKTSMNNGCSLAETAEMILMIF